MPLACLLALGGCGGQDAALDASVVQILLPDGAGSGFALNRQGDVVTAFHVIERQVAAPERISVVETGRRAGARHPVARIVWASSRLDLAVLRVEGLSQPAAALQAGDPRKGEAVYAVGFPRLLADPVAAPFDPAVLDGSITRLRVDSWRRLRGGPPGDPTLRIIEHSATLYPGSSGGPLVNACGAVVGINDAGGFLRGAGPEVAAGPALPIRGASYAVDVAALTAELDRQQIPYRLADGPCGSTARGIWWGLAAAALAGAAFLLLRRRRPGSAAPTRDWILSGVGRDGRAIRVPIRRRDLARPGGSLTIGRDPRRCEIVIDDPTVSGNHARLRMASRSGSDPACFLVEDLRSTNGTFVEGRRVAPGADRAVPLPLGATLVLGGCRMRFTHG